jgi:hypothetical protein
MPINHVNSIAVRKDVLGVVATFLSAAMTSVCVRNFGTTNVASKDTGVPIPVIEPGWPLFKNPGFRTRIFVHARLVASDCRTQILKSFLSDQGELSGNYSNE